MIRVLTALAGPEDEFTNEIRPILEKNCFECHGPEKHKGDLILTAYTNYTQVTEARETWQKALEMVQAFEMPPKGKKELNFGDHGKLLRWLRRLPKPERADCDQIASDRTANFYKGYVMSRRLNRAEYHNTLRDLLGVELHVEDLLPADGGGGEGFDTSGNALFTSSIHIEKYLAAAEYALESVLPARPATLDPKFEQARSRILVAVPSRKLSSREAARRIIGAFARKAFRRPVTQAETERLLSFFDRAQKRGDRFVPSVRLALTAVLVSPHFLFLAEPEPGKEGVHRLGGVPLASKLSYFLWSTMPDEELLTLAESSKLLDEQTYRQQVRRMLHDPRAQALGERFALQWLDLDRLGTEVRPDAKAFPEFDDKLSESMRQEVVAYFNYIVEKDRPLLDLIDSNYTFVNEPLAKIYGLTNAPPLLQKVSLSDRNRGGVVGMAAVHTLTSFPLRTSPVLRGKWLMESFLGDRVKPPPPDVPALEQSGNAAHLSLREQLETHRSRSECASCHEKIDPLGFGLENFDVLGRWRDTDQGRPIDAQGTLPSGQTFTGPTGLKSLLLERKDDIIKHLVRKMTGYAFGRELNQFDQCVVDRTMETLQKNDYRASVLIEQIATSFPFRHRFYPKKD
ncbi:MAG TPA: DUF1592 domain-containing protein [Verrucomicrobiae bacterium]|nr:DUF1592 domain-containing protein [Verrucomicrobiae bacterium]